MTIEVILLIVHVLLCLALIGLILIQHGKGADAGAAFGSGASGTVFGAAGAASFIVKLTTWVAIAFFATSLSLAYIASHKDTPKGLQFDTEQTTPETVPPELTVDDVEPTPEPVSTPETDVQLSE